MPSSNRGVPVEQMRTYTSRGGRLGPELRQVVAHDLPRYQLPAEPWNLAEVFPDHDEVILEIGSGMGEATFEAAVADPATAIVAVEVLDRGVASLARAVARDGLTNVRIYDGDALVALRRWIPAASLAGVRVWFPDPWPKSKHVKRRIIAPSAVSLMADRLRPGGTLHVATDVGDYADQIERVLAGEETLEPMLVRGPRPTWRPYTKFEKAGQQAGRPAHDFVFAKRRDS